MRDVTPCGIFFVQIGEDLEERSRELFSYISASYFRIAHNFERKKNYPVLAVKCVTLISDDDRVVDSTQFLVPTENGNFMWVQAEIFSFVGLSPNTSSRVVN